VTDVRRLSVGDEALAEAAVRLFADDRSAPVDVAAFLGSPACLLLVSLAGEGGGDVAGWVYGQELVHPDGERTMLLYALDVDEPFHRQGHGRALVTAFVAEARAAGCTEVWVLTDDANVAANATYLAAGGKRETPDSVMYTWFIAPGREAGADPEA
jgi:ribosomal protein S18 acetylase RimI-like enzyme